MAGKRIVAVVTVKDGIAVQSFGYREYQPIGDPAVVVENLDRWGADEILMQVIDRSASNLGPDWSLLDRVAGLGIATPLIYGGGISSEADGIEVIRRGADRLVLDQMFRHDPSAIERLAGHVGAQALIAAMPLGIENGQLQWLDHVTRQSSETSTAPLHLLQEAVVSEALVIDWAHDGSRRDFDVRLIERFPLEGDRLIAFGGIGVPEFSTAVLSMPKVAAVAVGNALNYQEHAIQYFKSHASSLKIRPSSYSSTDGLVRND
jgi:cyclase